MRSHLFGLGIAIALPIAALPLLYLPPAHADEELTPQWGLGGKSFALRPKKDGTSGTEEDKDKDEKGGTTTFNLNNMEVKCQAQRADGDAPKSATGSARYLQEYKWLAYGTTTPSSQFFIYDATNGTEVNASPFRDPSITDQTQLPGKATASGNRGAGANNDFMTEMHHEFESSIKNQLVDTGSGHPLYHYEPAPVSASAKADSIGVAHQQNPAPPSDPDQPAPPNPPLTYTYPNKACFAEGRSYWNFSAPRPYTPPTP